MLILAHLIKGADDESHPRNTDVFIVERVPAGFCGSERVKSDIEQRIINNGVPEANFTLSIVPNDQADQPDSQVVGHCANDTHKILYTRTSSGNAPANTAPSQDGASAEPQ